MGVSFQSLLYSDFTISQTDYCEELLKEAHVKHSVPLNVPPQLNPPTDPVKPVYCEKLKARLEHPELLPYPPLYGPPPRLAPMEAAAPPTGSGVTATRAPPPTSGPATTTTTPTTPTATVHSVSVPAATTDSPGKVTPIPDASAAAGTGGKQFTCSICGKGFRVALSAEHHLTSKHAGERGAILVGPIQATPQGAGGAGTAGAGIGGGMSIPPPPTPPASAGAATTGSSGTLSATASPAPAAAAVKRRSLSALPNPLKALLSMNAPSSYDGGASQAGGGTGGGGESLLPATPPPIYDLPLEEDIDNLLLDTWDVVGRATLAAKYVPVTQFVVGNTDPAAPTNGTRLQTSSTSDLASASPYLSPAGSDAGKNAASFNSAAAVDAVDPKLLRRFACGACDKAFRILDALVNHYRTKHGTDIPDDLFVKYSMLDKPSVSAFLKPPQPGKSDNGGAAGGAQGGGAAKRIDPLPVISLTAHIRTPINMQLVGDIKEIRCGYVQNDPVLQLLIAAVEEPSSPSSEASKADAAAHVEYVTVRCFGTYGRLIRESLTEGSRVAVTGCLKLNYHVDPISGQSHAYPFVSVVNPYGSVLPLESF